MLTTGVGGPHILAEPVVIHLIDLVDENEPGFREVIGGRHDHVPQPPGANGFVYLAGNPSTVVYDVSVLIRPVTPNHLIPVCRVQLVGPGLFLTDRKGEIPFTILFYRLHELFCYQQGQIELPQPAVFPFRPDEIHDVRVADIEGSHLGTTPAAGR